MVIILRVFYDVSNRTKWMFVIEVLSIKQFIQNGVQSICSFFMNDEQQQKNVCGLLDVLLEMHSNVFKYLQTNKIIYMSLTLIPRVPKEKYFNALIFIRRLQEYQTFFGMHIVLRQCCS